MDATFRFLGLGRGGTNPFYNCYAQGVAAGFLYRVQNATQLNILHDPRVSVCIPASTTLFLMVCFVTVQLVTCWSLSPVLSIRFPCDSLPFRSVLFREIGRPDYVTTWTRDRFNRCQRRSRKTQQHSLPSNWLSVNYQWCKSYYEQTVRHF